MNNGRLEAFSDGVLAIIITIMVFEIKAPELTTWDALRSVWPVFLSFVLSFIHVGIYWNNHHHMMKLSTKINGNVLWANMHLLFWLTLVPFTTSWLGRSNFASVPTQVYGISLGMCGVAYWILQTVIIKSQGPDSLLARAIGKDLKGRGSVVGYLAGVGLSPYDSRISMIIYAAIAAMWLIPDPRIERFVEEC